MGSGRAGSALKQPNNLIQGRDMAAPPVAQCQWCESSNHLVEEFQAMRESTTPEEQLDFIANVWILYPYDDTYIAKVHGLRRP
ncbi:unnamed protein product [Linum trigynum]|uniref:Uncharacterized protein n=1 Tax=Linum trigynum TaxID=586398 RepID=A0AAV2E683_9ROSI